MTRINSGPHMLTLQRLIATLQAFWDEEGCLIDQPYDMPMGAGTMHPATFLRVLGPDPWRCAYVQPSRRPADGRYGENPFRLGKHLQLQVVLKPSPPDVQRTYLRSLERLGIASRSTTSASKKTTGKRRRSERGAWAGRC